MLALQMIRIMDRIWLQEGLDLRIVNFKCISTGRDKGDARQISTKTLTLLEKTINIAIFEVHSSFSSPCKHLS